jgi:hypothetical protein
MIVKDTRRQKDTVIRKRICRVCGVDGFSLEVFCDTRKDLKKMLNNEAVITANVRSALLEHVNDKFKQFLGW